jgi:hypothetical protein
VLPEGRSRSREGKRHHAEAAVERGGLPVDISNAYPNFLSSVSIRVICGSFPFLRSLWPYFNPKVSCLKATILGNGQKCIPRQRLESELEFRLLMGTRRHSTGTPEVDDFCRPSTEEFGVRIVEPFVWTSVRFCIVFFKCNQKSETLIQASGNPLSGWHSRRVL